MIKYKLFKLLIIIYFILILIFPSAALKGASNGLILWFEKILPTLLPLIIISNIIINSNVLAKINPFYYGIIIGLFTGIPMGAKTSKDLLVSNKITLEDATFLLSFCSNPSPMFIISYITIIQLNLPQGKYHLLIVLLLSSLISSLIINFFKNLHKINSYNKSKHKFSAKTIVNTSISINKIDSSIMDGFEVITKIGGYIMLFSILAEIIFNINFINNNIKYLIIGFIEITNGINKVSLSPLDVDTKIKLIAIITSFGGLSSLAQTKSVINNSSLSISHYIISKILNIAITYILITIYINLFLFNII